MTKPTGISPAAARASRTAWEDPLFHTLTARAWEALWVHGRLLSSETKLIIYLLSKTHSLKTCCQPACTVRALEPCPPLLGSIRSELSCVRLFPARARPRTQHSVQDTPCFPVQLPRATDSPSETALDSVPSSPFQACNDLTRCCHVSSLTPAAASLRSSSRLIFPPDFHLQTSARSTVC